MILPILILFISLGSLKFSFGQNNANLNWTYISQLGRNYLFSAVNSDSSGQHLIMSISSYNQIVISEDFGNNWYQSPNPNEAAWVDFASDSTGQNITGVSSGGGIYISKNYGDLFNQTYTATNPESAFKAVAVSSDAVFQYATQTKGPFLKSNDSGESWLAVSVDIYGTTDQYYSGVATSSNGSCVYLTLYFVSYGGQPMTYYSHDYGATWGVAMTNNYYWVWLATNADGQYVAATTQYNTMFMSTDYGVTYTLVYKAGVNSQISIRSVSMDPTGQYLSAATWNGGVLMSYEYGANNSWFTSSAPLIDIYNNSVRYEQIAMNWNATLQVAATQSYSGAFTTSRYNYVAPVDDDNIGEVLASVGFGLIGVGIAALAVGAIYLYFTQFYNKPGVSLANMFRGGVVQHRAPAEPVVRVSELTESLVHVNAESAVASQA